MTDLHRPDILKSEVPVRGVSVRRRVLGIASMAAAAATVGHVFVLSWVLGHLAGKLGGGRATGIPGRVRSIIIPLGQWKLHLHHWICSLGLMGIASLGGIYLFGPQVTYGFLGGLAFQGIYCYSDWYRIIKRG